MPFSFFKDKNIQQPNKDTSRKTDIVRQAKGRIKINQQQAASLKRWGCKACPLNNAPNKTPKMKPTLVEDTLIYFLGMCPGENEDLEGKPFVGKSGILLRERIPDELIDHCSFDNIVRDRTPRVTKDDGTVEDREPSFVEIECCRGLVTASIEQAKPKLIVGLGIPPQKWAIDSEDQLGLRGRIFTIKVGTHTCFFMPTYHPSRVMRANADSWKKFKRRGRPTLQDDLESYWGYALTFDLKRAYKYIEEAEVPTIETQEAIRESVITFNGNDWDILIDLLDQTKKAPVKSVDIETPCLRPYANKSSILTVAFSLDEINFSFALDHKDSKWTQKQRDKLKSIIRDIISDDTIKIAHNAPFECEWFAYFLGRDSIKLNAWEDTQMQAHFLNERRGAGQSNDDSRRATYLGLGFLVNMYFGVPFKKWFELDKKNMANAPIQETLVYNAADTRFTLMLWHWQNQLLRIEGLYNAYKGAVSRQPMLALTQLMGLPVNQQTVKRLQVKLEGEISVIKAEIENLDIVQKYIADKKSFNPLGQDAIIIFRDYLNRDEIKIQDGDKVRWSIDKNILEKINHDLARSIVKLRNKTKMKSTYVDGFEMPNGTYIWPDGKIHCNLNATFTTTGRLSYSEPNGQNFPSRADNWVREQVEAPDGYMLIAADYGQLEMCGAAMCSKDKALVDVLLKDYDTHMEWAAKLAKICPERVGGDFNDPKVAKAFRGLVKNKVVFPAIYGASNRSMAEYLSIEEHYVDELMDSFWETFKGIKEWQVDLLERYRENGYVETLTGRKRHYPLTNNEAINSPIQGTASDIVINTMEQMSSLAQQTGKWYLHPILNIHDDEMFLVPEKHLDEAVDTIDKILLEPTFDFINVPLSIDIKSGKNWANMTSLGKFWWYPPTDGQTKGKRKWVP